MEILHQKKIVLLGMMSKIPVAGVVWQTAHYLEGLRRLGFDVYYVEAHACTPTTLMQSESDDGAALASNFIAKACARFGFEGKWAYHALQVDGRVYGMSESALNQLYQEAALLINLHGATLPRPEHYATNRLVYLETDPVQVQIELHDNNAETLAFLEPHCAFFTFGENYGKADCGLPVSKQFDFKPTRQPVVRDFWESAAPPRESVFTTVGNWEQSQRKLQFKNQTYDWSKHTEFLKFIDLPAHVNHGTRFELALSRCPEAAERMLREKGWGVKRSMDFSFDADAYRRYISESLAEFTVAKDQNVRLRSGWFSDRSATYLAAGRPVITQDTGFANIIQSDGGLFSFTNMAEILAAVEAINSDYARHSKAASEVARNYFDHEVVLGKMVSDLGLSRP